MFPWVGSDALMFGSYVSVGRIGCIRAVGRIGCLQKTCFFNFSRFPLKYPTSAYISGIYAFTEERLISTDLIGAAGNYGLSVFFSY